MIKHFLLIYNFHEEKIVGCKIYTNPFAALRRPFLLNVTIPCCGDTVPCGGVSLEGHSGTFPNFNRPYTINLLPFAGSYIPLAGYVAPFRNWALGWVGGVANKRTFDPTTRSNSNYVFSEFLGCMTCTNKF